MFVLKLGGIPKAYCIVIRLYIKFNKKTLTKQKKNNIPASSENKKWMFQKKYKDQNDRNAKIYRFKTSPDHFVLNNQ